jgi:hypothetical protein
VTHSNTESLFLWNNVGIQNLLSCSIQTSYMPLENHKQNGFERKVLMLVLIPDLHSILVPKHLHIFNQSPETRIDVILRLLWPRYQSWHHNIFLFVAQPRRMVKIINTIGCVLCVLLFMNGFMPSVLIAILIFLKSMANSRFCESMFHLSVASVGFLVISASCLCFSLCHRNNSYSLFTYQQ